MDGHGTGHPTDVDAAVGEEHGGRKKIVGALIEAKHLIERPLREAKARAQAEAQRLEQQLRATLGGNDDSLSTEHVHAALRAKYAELFAAMDPLGSGLVCIEDLEDLCGSAGLFEARNETGVLAYDADTDGNGALSFDEFVQVLDNIREYHTAASAAPHPSRGSVAAPASFVFGTEGAHLTLRQVAFRTLDDPCFSDLARVVGAVDIVATVLAIVVFVLQSVPSLDAGSPGFAAVEGVAAAVFIGLLGGRFLTCDSKRAFVASPWNWVDFLTVVPYLLDEVYGALVTQGGGGGGGGAALRVLRVFRSEGCRFGGGRRARSVPHPSGLPLATASVPRPPPLPLPPLH